MPEVLKRYATPLTTGLFLVSLISGVALFFHIGGHVFHGMHEWLSMVLILPFILHVWKNWRTLAGYFRQFPMILSLVLSVVAGAAFAIPSAGEGGGGSPQRALFQTFENGTVTQLAPLLGHSAESLTSGLRSAGLQVDTVDQRLADIAKASRKPGFEVVRIATSLKR